MRTLAAILTIAGLSLEGLVIAMFDHGGFASFADIFRSQQGLSFLGIHALSCFLFGFGAAALLSKDGRRAVLASFILYFTLAFTFPLFGMLGALAMVWMLRQGARKERVQEEFIVGNPMLDRWSIRSQDHDPELHLRPLCASMRDLDRDGLAGMILGLRDQLPSERAHGILERYQQDLNSQVQFYAQSALSGEIERIEGHLATLGHRVRQDPQNEAPRIALAEMLIDLASRRSTTATDREVNARHALRHLEAAIARAPDLSFVHFLKARACLLLGESATARQMLDRLESQGAPATMTERIRAKLAFEEGDMTTLARIPANIHPEFSPSIRFWKSDQP